MTRWYESSASRVALAFSLTALFHVPALASPKQYQVTTLAALGGSNASASAIDAHGVVVGGILWTNRRIGRIQRAVVWNAASAALYLGTLGGTISGASAVGPTGSVAGIAGIPYHAVLWRGVNGSLNSTQPDDLGTLGGEISVASGVGADDTVVGYSTLTPNSNQGHAFTWHAGVMTDLGTLISDGRPGTDIGYSEALAINKSGVVVGSSSSTPANKEHACLWDTSGIYDLGTLPGFISSNARAINDAGVVVGSSSTYGNPISRRPTVHACVWMISGEITDITPAGVSYSIATGINSSGVVVGSYTTPNSESHGFVYQNGIFVDLNTVVDSQRSLTITSASAINDRGQIAATATDEASGLHYALLLTPGLMTHHKMGYKGYEHTAEDLIKMGKPIPPSLVADWKHSAAIAVTADGNSVDAQLSLAKAATIANDYKTADTAMQRALALCYGSDNFDVYRWALKMYGDDGFREAPNILQVAHRAANDTSLSIDELTKLIQVVHDDAFGMAARTVLRTARSAAETRLHAALPAPSGLAAMLFRMSATSLAWVDLSWKPSIGATTYNIYRSTIRGGEDYSNHFAQVWAPVKNFSDLHAYNTPSTRYYYTVRALDAYRLSAASNETRD